MKRASPDTYFSNFANLLQAAHLFISCKKAKNFLSVKRTNAIGIDLGTASSCVAVFTHGKVEIIPNEDGNRTTPSYVAFTDTGRLIGDSAKNHAAINPQNTVFG